MNIRDLVREIHRRSLWQVLGVYLAAAWFGYEAIDALTERLQLPDWLPAIAIVLFLLGLPVVLATAIVQEGLPDRDRPDRGRPDPTLLPTDASLATETGTGRSTAAAAASGLRRFLTWRNALMGGVFAFALWGLVAAVWLVAGRPATRDAEAGASATGSAVEADATSAVTVAVLPFRAVGPELELWREGMVDLLSTNLDGAAGLRTVDPRTLLSRWRREIGDGVDPTDRAAALAVARGTGAAYALLGSAVGLGNRVRLSAEIFRLDTGDLEGTVQAEGGANEVLELVDQLSVQALTEILAGVTGARERFDLSRVTTASVPALKAYLQGEQAFRRNRFEAALAAYQRAVALDSTFALALYKRGWSRNWLEAEPEPGRADIRRAADLGDRLPERERLLFHGAAMLEGGYPTSWPEGFEPLEQLTARYPDLAEGWFVLGDAYFHYASLALIPIEKAQHALARAVELDPDFGPAYYHLIHIAFMRGDRAEATRLLARLRAVDSTAARTAGITLAHTLAWGEGAARARAEAELPGIEGAALGETARTLQLQPDFWAPALEAARALSAPRHRPGDRVRGLRLQAKVLALRGRLREAADVIGRSGRTGALEDGVPRAALTLDWLVAGYPEILMTAREAAAELGRDPDPETRFRVGALAAYEGRRVDLDRTIADLESGAETAESRGEPEEAARHRSVARALRCYAAVLRSDLQAALSEFHGPMPNVPEWIHAFLRYQLGRLLLKQGEPREAERYFASLLPSDWGYYTPTQFELGRVYEALDDNERAKLHYARFVRYWADCDPELRDWRERARRALARLAAESVDAG